MKLLSRPDTKKVNYFGIEFELDVEFSGYIKTHAEGWVYATAVDWRGDFISSTYLGIVDLEGMDWKDTLVEIK
jgi:hypothetical protein